MVGTLVRRLLDVEFEGVPRIRGRRISARITVMGGEDLGTMHAAIYGMPLSLMNKLSTLGQVPDANKYSVTLYAGESDVNAAGDVPPTTAMTLVFLGTVTNAYADMAAMPEVCFRVVASVGAKESVMSIPPTSLPGKQNAADMLSALAGKMGLKFENNGVNTPLYNPAFPGSAREQALAIVKAANSEWIIDKGTLAIWPSGQQRGGGSGGTILIAPPDMVGYPAFTNQGVMVRTLFKRGIEYGRPIEIRSDMTPANGSWVVYSLAHSLDSETPNGEWYTTIEAAKKDYVVRSIT